MSAIKNIRKLLSPDERRFVQMINILGGQSWIVGGAVRDVICGRSAKDIDLEVCGVSPETLESLPGFVVIPAGDRFAVWLVRPVNASPGETFEVCVPHVRQKVGPGRMDEIAIIDIDLPIEISLGRRDFTCNAMAVNAVTGELVDPFGGQADLDDGILRAVNADNFGHDPVRVLRGMRFASTHGLVASPETIQAAREHIHEGANLDNNRKRQEWVKWARGSYPALGIQFLRDAGWLVHFPALGNLDGIQQHPVWHPEGDALTHTILAVQALRNADEVAVWATLLHDIGKATCQMDDGTSRGHADVSAAMVPDFFRSIGFEWHTPPAWVEAVAAICREHMWVMGLQVRPSDRAVRNLARRLGDASVREWASVCLADIGGRGAASRPEDGHIILEIAERAGSFGMLDDAPRAILMGRHLIELGLRPGPHFGAILEDAMQAQMDGAFDDEAGAMAWLAEYLT